METKFAIQRTYQVYLTPNTHKALKFSYKKTAQAFAAAIQTEGYEVKTKPRSRSNSYDTTNNYVITVQKVGEFPILYVQYYKEIVDKFSLQHQDNPLKE